MRQKIWFFNFQSCSFSCNHMMAAFPVHNTDQWELELVFLWSNKILKHVSCLWRNISKVITLNKDAVKWTQPESIWSSRTRGVLISLLYQRVYMCHYMWLLCGHVLCEYTLDGQYMGDLKWMTAGNSQIIQPPQDGSIFKCNAMWLAQGEFLVILSRNTTRGKKRPVM
jgi:hypothetical protein